MSAFTGPEVAYLTEGTHLARLATVGADGMPHVTPVGYRYDPSLDAIEIRGIKLSTTKKFRDATRNPLVALVVDDVLPPWRPRGIEVRGRAETVGGDEALIRIRPTRVVSWGIESSDAARHARDVAQTT